MIHGNKRNFAKKLRAFGFSRKAVSHTTGLSLQQTDRALYERRDAVTRQLVREGCSRRAIAMNFTEWERSDDGN